MVVKNSSLALRALAAAVAAAALAAPIAANAAPKQDRVRIVVAFKPGAEAAMRAAITNAGGRVVLELKEVDAVAVDLPRRAFAALKRSPHAEFVEEDAKQHVMRMPAHGSAAAKAAATGQSVPYGISMVQADQVSDASAGNRTLCIVNSGIQAVHEDHLGNNLAGFNYTTSGTWDTDENFHGTHVAGTVAAVNNTLGVIGVMPNKQINLFIAKVFDASGSASSSTVAKAMLGCRSKGNASVISMSLGGSKASMLQQKVATFLDKKGVLMIAAAGNAGTSAVSYPAGFAEVVSVAAIDGAKAWATFSQFNSDVEIAAPGVSVVSTVIMGSGSETLVTVGATSYGSIPLAGTPALIATGALYNFGLGTATDPGAAGKVCLIQRGGAAFSDKVLNCQNSGGVGAVIYNNVPGPLSGTLSGVVTSIPSAGVTDVDGASMLGQIGQSATVDTANVVATNYAPLNGTSMATPHASAVAALVWSLHTNCTAAQMRISLNNSAMDLGPVGRDVNFGYGLIQAKAAHDRIMNLGCGV